MTRGWKAALGLMLALALTLSLAGCRVRTMPGGGVDDAASPDGTAAPEAGQALSEEAAMETLAQEDMASEGKPGDRTRENPEASRREYDENAPAEIVAGTERQLHAPGEGNGAPLPDGEAEKAAVQADDGAEEPATRTVAAEEAE